MEARVEVATLDLARPLEAAYGSVGARRLALLHVRACDGFAGVGEAAPLEPYDGVQFDACRAELEAAAAALRRTGGDWDAALGEATLAPARAALDVARLDLEGRRAGRPVWALAGASAARAVEVNATIGAAEPDEAAGEGAAARRAGFRCVKVKVGAGDDEARISAVREAAGESVAIRLDANGAWSVEEARAALAALARHGVELCEEPVRGVDAFRELRGSVPVPVAMDETAAEPGALESGAADAVCLKVARCGGITGVVEAALRARAAGSDVYLASSLDGPVGITAALHAAAAIAPDRPCGLATLGHFLRVEDPFPPRDGIMRPPDGPGLGL